MNTMVSMYTTMVLYEAVGPRLWAGAAFNGFRGARPCLAGRICHLEADASD